MIPRNIEQLGGWIILVLGLWLTYFTWNLPSLQGPFVLKAAAFGPGAALLGLALIAFPSYRRERLQRGEDISRLRGTQLITRRWWAVLVIALVLGLANLVLLSARTPV